jgi:hypothetical protein
MDDRSELDTNKIDDRFHRWTEAGRSDETPVLRRSRLSLVGARPAGVNDDENEGSVSVG